MTPKDDPKKKKRFGVFSWSWVGFDLLLVFGAVLAGLLVWFLPNFENSPEIQKLYARQKNLREAERALEAEEARIRKENEELGLVYIQPGTNPFPTKPPAVKKPPQ